MQDKNNTNFQNDTTIIDVKDEPTVFGWFQTVFLSFVVVSAVILFFASVYYIVRKKRYDHLRHRLVPMYHFDPGECEDWEEELIEDSKILKQKKNHYYRSMSSPEVTTNQYDHIMELLPKEPVTV